MGVIMESESNNNKKTVKEMIKYFFVNPTKAFEDFKDRPKYGILFLIIAIMSGLNYVLTQTLAKDSIDDLITKSAGNPQAQQSAEMITNIIKSPIFITVMAIVTMLLAIVSMYIVSFIYYLFIKAFKGNIKYNQAVSIYSLAYIAAGIGGLVYTIYAIITKQTFQVPSTSYFNVIVNNLDVFKLWQMVLLVFGISAVTGLTKKKGISIVVIVFCLSLLLQLGFFAFNQSIKNLQPAVGFNTNTKITNILRI